MAGMAETQRLGVWPPASPHIRDAGVCDARWISRPRWGGGHPYLCPPDGRGARRWATRASHISGGDHSPEIPDGRGPRRGMGYAGDSAIGHTAGISPHTDVSLECSRVGAYQSHCAGIIPGRGYRADGPGSVKGMRDRRAQCGPFPFPRMREISGALGGAPEIHSGAVGKVET